MISVEVEDSADSNWNQRLLDSNFGTTAQIKEVSNQFLDRDETPHYLKFVNSKGNVVGQLLLSESKRFKENKEKSFLKKIIGKSNLVKFTKIKSNIYKWSYGPIVFDNDDCSEIYVALKNFLLKSSNHQIIGWQHPFVTNGINILKNDFEIIPWSTFIIDLTKTKDELFSNIEKNSGQKNIRRAIQRGIDIEEITQNNLYEYFILLNESKETSVTDSDYEQFEKNWNLLKPYGRGGFIARKNSKIISGLSFSAISGHIIEGGVARSSTDKSSVLYSQDLIKWKIIEWGVENNMNWYNLAGFNPNPSNSKEEGILRFKKKWGGKRFDYYGIKLV